MSKTQTPETVAEAIRMLGGDQAVAEAVGLTRGACRAHRMAGAFPPRLYLSLSAFAKTQGVELPPSLFQEVKREDRYAQATQNG